MLIEENWRISCLLPLLPPLQCPDFTCAVQLWATMQWWAHFWYQSCVFLQLEFSVSVFILFLILSLTVLFFSLLSYPFISLLMPLLPPKQLPYASWAPEEKQGMHWRVFPLLSVPQWCLEWEGQHKALLSHPILWNVRECSEEGGACTEPLNCAQRAESWETKIWIHGLERLELFYCSITSCWNQTNPKVQVAI